MKIASILLTVTLFAGTPVCAQLVNDGATSTLSNVTTNLVDWYFLGPATPRYLFTDTNAPAVPQRYYRLHWP